MKTKQPSSAKGPIHIVRYDKVKHATSKGGKVKKDMVFAISNLRDVTFQFHLRNYYQRIPVFSCSFLNAFSSWKTRSQATRPSL